MKILAIDPGETTGVSVIEKINGEFFTIRIDQWFFSNWRNPHHVFYLSLGLDQVDLIVYESFQFRQGMTGAVFKGIEYIGVIELFRQMNNITCATITPSQGKAFWDNRKLKAMGVWHTGLPHAMDATRVLYTYLMKNDAEFKIYAMNILAKTLKGT